MTPEERAASLMTQLACKRGQEVGWEPHTGREDAWIESSIAAAIRSAVEAEREECAAVARSYYHSAVFGSDPRRADECEAIADAIRARTATEPRD